MIRREYNSFGFCCGLGGGAKGFPADYQLPQQHRTAVHLLGNAVCPPVARDVIAAIREAA